MGWWRPREVSGPARLSHSRGSCHSAAKVSASRTYFITRPKGEGLGLDVDWRLKVFCPAFLQKSGRGPGAEPWPRAAARGTLLVLTKRRRGLKGGTLAGGSPLCGRPKPPAARAIYGRPQSSDAGRGWNPAPTRGWRNTVRPAETVAAGRRGRRPLQGGCGDVGLAVLPRRAGGWNHGQQKRRRPFRAFSSELPSGYHTTVMFRLGRTPFRVAVASMLFSSTG